MDIPLAALSSELPPFWRGALATVAAETTPISPPRVPLPVASATDPSLVVEFLLNAGQPSEATHYCALHPSPAAVEVLAGFATRCVRSDPTGHIGFVRMAAWLTADPELIAVMLDSAVPALVLPAIYAAMASNMVSTHRATDILRSLLAESPDPADDTPDLYAPHARCHTFHDMTRLATRLNPIAFRSYRYPDLLNFDSQWRPLTPRDVAYPDALEAAQASELPFWVVTPAVFTRSGIFESLTPQEYRQMCTHFTHTTSPTELDLLATFTAPPTSSVMGEPVQDANPQRRASLHRAAAQNPATPLRLLEPSLVHTRRGYGDPDIVFQTEVARRRPLTTDELLLVVRHIDTDILMANAGFGPDFLVTLAGSDSRYYTVSPGLWSKFLAHPSVTADALSRLPARFAVYGTPATLIELLSSRLHDPAVAHDFSKLAPSFIGTTADLLAVLSDDFSRR